MVLDTKQIIERHNAALIKARQNPELIAQALKDCSADIRRLSGNFNKVVVTPSRKSHLMTTIGLVKGINRTNYASSRVKWEDLKSAFNGRIRAGCIVNLSHKDPIEFLEDCGQLFVRRINNILKEEPFLKVNAVFCGKFVKVTAEEEIEDMKCLNTKNAIISRDSNVAEWFVENIMNKVLSELDEFQERDSGWALKEVINLMININKYTPQLGSSYIELPQSIENKKACINVKNDDNACFAWSVVAALYPADKHPQRVTKYKHYSRVLKLDGITFPVTREDITKFERMNNISVNVYALDKNKTEYRVVPTRLSKYRLEGKKHINLLLIQDRYEEEMDSKKNAEPIRYHYVLIKNLSRLVSSQLSYHHGVKYFCERCLHYFYSKEKLQHHLEDCKKLNDYKVSFPPQEGVKFENHKNKERVPFTIYADFECILRSVSRKRGNPSNTNSTRRIV